VTSGVQDGPRSARDRVAALARDGTPRRVLTLDALADGERSPADDPETVPLPPLEPPRPSSRLRRWLETWVPARLRGVRLDPGRPGALALAVVTASAAVLAAVGVWVERPVAEPAPPLAGVPADADPGGAEPAGAAAPLVVSVVGKVARPGLVQVPDGARVADALVAAGGPLPETDLLGLNLARKVADGEQLAVGVPQPQAAGEPGAAGPAGPGPATGGQSPSTGRVDLNRATPQQLDALPGIGPVTAQRILDWRAQRGRFTRVEQLREVDGIGERRFAQLRELVAV
jgi:competence protein ComEA